MRNGFLREAAVASAGNVREWSARYGQPASRVRKGPAPFLPDVYGGCGVIAEVKMRSPSRGDLMGGANPEQLAGIYERAGAESISVVVEEKHFGGSPELFEKVRSRVDLPMLWKDFVIDPYQVRLAAALGASALLFIVGLVPDEELGVLISLARESGLSSVVEIHDAGELNRALSAGADVVGVNNRDLFSLEVDTSTAQHVAALFPAGLRTVAESGMKSPGDVVRMAQLGYRAVLVGEALVTARDPETLLEGMVKAGLRERRV